MKYFFSLLFIVPILSCSQKQKKFLSESTVLKIHQKKSDSLRVVLKDSLAKGIKPVNDYNHDFLPTEKDYLDSLISDFKRRTSIQLNVFTYDSLMLSKDSVEIVTMIIGIKNQINTTVGFSFPYKTMSIWSDSLINNSIFSKYEAKYMIDKKFIPYFKKGESFKGAVEGLNAIFQRMINNRKFNKST